MLDQQTETQLQQQAVEINPTMEAFLQDKVQERDVIIMRLRAIDAVLVKYGWLKHETLPRRVR